MKVKRSLSGVLFSLGLLILLVFSVMVQAQEQPTEEPQPTEEVMDMSGMSMDAPITPETAKLISDVRKGTADFRNFDGVEAAGYGKFLDCFLNNNVGGMGQHYVNGDFVGDDVLDPMKPEALVYEPTEDGQMNLVAFEYLVFADAWDPDNTGRAAPELFGREFHLKTNIPDTPPVWTLHIWLWTSNPGGVFADYNPLVFCPTDYPVTDMTPQS